MNPLFSTTTKLLADLGPSEGSAIIQVFSPARINLIGDHVDYCGGMVIPAAINFGTAFSARLNGSSVVRVVSANQPGITTFDVTAEQSRQGTWGDYVVGVFEQYRKHRGDLPGMDIAIAGDIPGSCLSSSASLGVGIGLLLELVQDDAWQPSLESLVDRRQLALRVQKSENEFVGMNCGIMDQAAVALGRHETAMQLDCVNLEVGYLPVNTGSYQLLVADTRKDRQLVTSAYNQRRSEVDTALEILQQDFDLNELCELEIEVLPTALSKLKDPILVRRVRHVVTEQNRVMAAGDNLNAGNLIEFGSALNASHASLRDDYEVTGSELDTLIGCLQKQTGVLGARMMGAGFGGCGLVLVNESSADEMIEATTTRYTEVIGYEPAFYSVQLVDGVHVVPPVAA